jgi:hypothetical protein
MRRLREKDSLLTGTRLRHYIIIGIVIILGACNRPTVKDLPSGESYGKIIYDTFIVNRDSTDSWGNESLSAFNRKALIDKIFDAVLDGKITPYDYFSGEKVSIGQIKKMEIGGEFSRDKISKIQFEERWIWDDQKVEMRKEIISMTIAYEVYNNSGVSRGQKPIFKLIFRK